MTVRHARLCLVVAAIVAPTETAAAAARDYPVKPVPFTSVHAVVGRYPGVEGAVTERARTPVSVFRR
jgi:hypothetical protein